MVSMLWRILHSLTHSQRRVQLLLYSFAQVSFQMKEANLGHRANEAANLEHQRIKR
jgi:hypothetical protein